MELVKIVAEEFDRIYGARVENFIESERRDYHLAKSVLYETAYSVYHIVEKGERIGFITLWQFDGFTFVEHFVIYQAFRNQGFGEKVLNILKRSGKPIVLECERAVESLAKRRLSFYERNGFYRNDVDYYQPPYRKSDAPVPMELLSFPRANKNVDEIVKILQKQVYKMKICDMHVHSCFSDGSSTPTELINEAISIGLSAIALTDHNNIGGAEEFLKASKGKDVQAVIGVEFSTDYGNKELHILGLFIAPEHYDKVAKYCEQIIINKENSNKIMIERLKKAGYDIDYGEVRANCKGTMNRAHIGAVLYKKGYTKTIEEVFEKILSKDGCIYESARRLDVFKTIKFIRSIGAIPVLAHPFLDLTESELRVFLAKATANGLIGMETDYTTYSDEQTALARKIAEEYGLKRSGGSDYHGVNKDRVALAKGRGNLIIPYSIYENLRPKKGE